MARFEDTTTFGGRSGAALRVADVAAGESGPASTEDRIFARGVAIRVREHSGPGAKLRHLGRTGRVAATAGEPDSPKLHVWTVLDGDGLLVHFYAYQIERANRKAADTSPAEPDASDPRAC